jgi:hypothetical protein
VLDALLAELEPLLFRYNYQVFLHIYRIPFAPDAPAEWYITQALGPAAIIGGVVPTTRPEILSEVKHSLRYPGDAGSGPRRNVLLSNRFNALVEAVLAELELAITEAGLLVQIWLREGHPAYPVFWDFTFVIAGPSGGLVFVGSSSN